MAKKDIYKITVTNFMKYNKGVKKSYKCTLISNNFCSDAKLRTLPMTTRWLFLNIVLTCGDCGRDTVELSSRSLRDMFECNRSIDEALITLQQLQILSYEKIESLIKLKENKLKEIKVKETNSSEVEKAEIVLIEKPKPDKELNRLIKESYIESYLARYKIKPTFNAKVNAQISQLATRLGHDAIDVVKFYLTHNDSFFLKSCHSIGPLLTQAESLHSQWKRNIQVTGTKIKQFEKQNTYQETLDAIERGEV